MLKHFKYIDGLRGLAIMGVVLIHVGQLYQGQLPGAVQSFTNYGIRGVQLFFMVSALTLTMSLDGKNDGLRSYALKRFFRIAPMFYLAVLGYLLLDGTGPRNGDPEGTSLTDILLTFAFLHGLSPSAINSAVPGGWSIANEALFYCLLPVLGLVVRDFRSALVATLLSLGLAVASPWVMRYILGGVTSEWALKNYSHFNFFIYLPSFCCGIAIFHVLKSERFARHLHQRSGYLLLLGGAALVTAIGLSGIPRLQHVLLANVPLSAIVLGAAITNSKIFSNALMKHIGMVSFSIYLWHFAVVQAVTATIGTPNLVLSYLLVLGISLALATVTYFTIEAPAMRFAKTLASRPPRGSQQAVG